MCPLISPRILQLIISLLEKLETLTEERNVIVAAINNNMLFASSFLQSPTSDVIMQSKLPEMIHGNYDELFKKKFSMKPSTFQYIFEMIADLLGDSLDGQQISPEKQLLICIQKLVGQDSYRTIAQAFNVHQVTVMMAIRNVITELCKISPYLIEWPDGVKVQQVFRGFEEIADFPNVIGAIKETVIKITSPEESNTNDNRYVQLQAVCDHQLKFTHCFVYHTKAVNHRQAFEMSPIRDYVAIPQKFPQRSHILGGTNYPLHKHLLTPYPADEALSEKEINYNRRHFSTQLTISHAIALLKGRFKSLQSVLNIHHTNLISKYVLACCVLHNICIMQGEEVDDMYFENEQMISNNLPSQSFTKLSFVCRKRNEICNQLPL